MMPEANPLPRLRDELRAVDFAVERLLARPRYDEAALAELQVRQRELQTRISAERENMEVNNEHAGRGG